MKKRFNLLIILFPIWLIAQDWTFDVDSLKENELNIPMIINPLIDGYTPVIDYSKNLHNSESGKVYNGFQVQVVSVDNLLDAEVFRDTLMKQIDDRVEVVFDAPNYKVRVGAFTDRQDAEILLNQLIRMGYRRSWIIRARLTY